MQVMSVIIMSDNVGNHDLVVHRVLIVIADFEQPVLMI